MRRTLPDLRRPLDLSFRTATKLARRAITWAPRVDSNRRSRNGRRVLAMPYYPLHWPGGHERIGNWKPYFEAAGWTFDVHWAFDDEEFIRHRDLPAAAQYDLYFRLLKRRLAVIKDVADYGVLWIQRAFIPLYPYRDAYFERALASRHPGVVVDFYDADYVSNYDLTMNTVRSARRVTVSTPFLQDKFRPLNADTRLVNMTIDPAPYATVRTERDDVRIGWMGNPGNARFVLEIEDELRAAQQSHEALSCHFLCAAPPKWSVPRVREFAWSDPGFDYHRWFEGLDIGIAPYLGDSDAERAKSPMKTLEFFACKLPVVASPNGAFRGMVDGEHFLLAANPGDWARQLGRLAEDPALRRRIGEAGHQFLLENHTYEANFEALRESLDLDQMSHR